MKIGDVVIWTGIGNGCFGFTKGKRYVVAGVNEAAKRISVHNDQGNLVPVSDKVFSPDVACQAGDWVLCIDDSNHNQFSGKSPFIRADECYRISRVSTSSLPLNVETIGENITVDRILYTLEFPDVASSPPKWYSFAAVRFVKAKEPNKKEKPKPIERSIEV